MKRFGPANRGVPPVKLQYGLAGGRTLLEPAPVAAPTLNMPLGAADVWTATSLTVGTDSVNFLRAHGSGTAAGKRITCGSGGTLAYDIASTDLSGCVMMIGFYVYPGSGNGSWLNLGRLDVDLFSDASYADNTHRGRFTFYDPSTVPGQYQATGWRYAGRTLTAELAMDVVGASFNPATVTRVRINTNNTANKTPQFTLAYLAFVPKPAKPGVCIMLDNSYAAQYDAAKYAKSKGINIGIGVVSGLIGTAGYLTEGSLAELAGGGVMPYNHTDLHQAWAAAGPEAALADALRCSDWLWQRGYRRGAGIVSSPGQGPGLAGTFERLWQHGVDAIFSEHMGANAGSLFAPLWPNTRCLKWAGVGASAGGVGDMATAYAAMKAKGVGGILAGHDVWTIDGGVGFKALIDDIATDVGNAAVEIWLPDQLVKGSLT